MAYIRVDVDLDEFDDDEIEREYNRRFLNRSSDSIEDIYDYIRKHYWSPEQWARLQDELANANRYGRDL